MKNPNLKFTDRLPTVTECEKCPYQNECQGGKYCTGSKGKKGKKTIRNTVVDNRSDKGVKRKWKTM